MIGFRVAMENIYRNEHITPVFKIIIFSPNYWNCSSVINVACNGYARGFMSAVASEITGM